VSRRMAARAQPPVTAASYRRHKAGMREPILARAIQLSWCPSLGTAASGILSTQSTRKRRRDRLC
jgi:hypothetical protein